MAKSVYEVDHETRLILCDTEWAHKVLGELVSKGHTVIRVGSGDLADKVESSRSEEELARRDILLQESAY